METKKSFITLLHDLSESEIISAIELLNLKNEIVGAFTIDILGILYNFFKKKLLSQQVTENIILTTNLERVVEIGVIEDYNSIFLKILYKNKAISNLIFQTINRTLNKIHNPNYFYLICLCIELNNFNISFSIKNQLEFVEILKGKESNGSDCLLDLEKKNNIIDDINGGKLKSYLDFFKYCFGCRLIDLTNYQNKKSNLVMDVTNILNEIFYDTFTIQEILVEESDFIGEPEYENKQMTITIDTGVKTYKHIYTFCEDQHQVDADLNLLLGNILSFSNYLLAAFSAPYRVTGITNQLNEMLFPGARKDYAICRLEPQNRSVLDFYDMQNKFLFFTPNPLFNKFPLSYEHIKYALYHIEKSGLLSHIADMHFTNILATIFSGIYDSIGDLIAVFPDIIMDVNRTISSGEKPYLKFLLNLNRISKGILNFTKINDETPNYLTYEDDLTIKVSFLCNGRYHEVDCPLIGKEFCYKIMSYIINEIVHKDYNHYKIIQLMNSNHLFDRYLFVTVQQSNYLKSMKLISEVDRF